MVVDKPLGTLICQTVPTEAGDVLAYLSIPYARGQRFAKVEYLASSTDLPFNSSETYCFPQQAIPTKLNFFLKHHMLRHEWSVADDTPSEDAFVVNIWTRKKAERDPVLVFIHGSGDSNSGTTPIYNGANLAAKGLVVVTITYRIGNFGYLPVYDGKRWIANLAYFDQQLALRWIREHIAQFGGDEQNITLMGHSGGALAVNHHYLHPISSQYFDKVILCGGPLPRVRKNDHLLADYETMLQANRLQSLEDLKHLPARKVVRLKKAKRQEVLDGDFFCAPSAELLANQAFEPKPMLIGSNADEFSMIELPLYYKAMGITKKEQDLDRVLEEKYGRYATELKKEFAPEASDCVDLQIKILEALVLHYSAYRLINIYGQKSPVYGYRLDYAPNLFGGLRGAYHGAELALFFDNLDKMKIELTKENQKQTARLQQDWLAFIRTGQLPGIKPYREGGTILSYRGTGAEPASFPHADFLDKLEGTKLPEQMLGQFLANH